MGNRPSSLIWVVLLSTAAAHANTITGNFNGTSVPSGDDLYFTSVVKLTGSVPNTPFQLYATGGTITFTAGGTTHNLAVPDATISYVPGLANGSATTAYSGAFTTTVSPSSSGNDFLAAYMLSLPAGLPGGVSNVSWTENFTSNAAGVNGNWQWAAGAYSTLPSSYSSLGIKPSDDPNASSYANSDHAGSPENYLSYVIGGGTGGGGSNYTGSLSATSSFSAAQSSAVPEPSTVTLLGAGIAALGLAARRRAARKATL